MEGPIEKKVVSKLGLEVLLEEELACKCKWPILQNVTWHFHAQVLTLTLFIWHLKNL